MLICLRVRRLFCVNPDCVRTTFVEQVPGVAARYARRTAGPERMLTRSTPHVRRRFFDPRQSSAIQVAIASSSRSTARRAGPAH
jgi:hypothetical protein